MCLITMCLIVFGVVHKQQAKQKSIPTLKRFLTLREGTPKIVGQSSQESLMIKWAYSTLLFNVNNISMPWKLSSNPQEL